MGAGKKHDPCYTPTPTPNSRGNYGHTPTVSSSAVGAQAERNRQAQTGTTQDLVFGLSVTPGHSSGELVINWDAHPKLTKDYRVAWVPEDENFRTFTDTDWNAFPTGTQHIVTGLNLGEHYKVHVRAPSCR